MKVLLVGAAGTVGIALHKELASRGHQVRCVDLAPPRYEMAEALKLFGYDPNPPDAEWVYQDVTKPQAAEVVLKSVDAVAYVALSLALNDASAQFAVNLAGRFARSMPASSAGSPSSCTPAACRSTVPGAMTW